MSVPLLTLGVLSAIGGWIGIPPAIGNVLGGAGNAIESWLAPVFESGHAAETAHAVPPVEYGLMSASIAVAVLGALAARYMWLQQPQLPREIALRFQTPAAILSHKYYVDEFYDVVIVRPYNALSRFAWRVIDDGLIDGVLVGGTSAVVRWQSKVSGGWQTGAIPTYVTVFFGGVVAILVYYLFG
jgi:NADH-quinone oxidoreductase subunit L